MRNCFEAVVRDVVEEASLRFSPEFVLVPERLDILKEYCSAIDRIADEADADSFIAEVNEETMTVSVTAEAPAFTFSSVSDPFYELIDRSVSFGFRANKEGNTEAFFEFPSLWEYEKEDG